MRRFLIHVKLIQFLSSPQDEPANTDANPPGNESGQPNSPEKTNKSPNLCDSVTTNSIPSILLNTVELLNATAENVQNQNQQIPVCNAMHDLSPRVLNVPTPELSHISEITDKGISGDDGSISGFSCVDEKTQNKTENAMNILKRIRKKHMDNVLLGHLNINALANKFDALKLIIGGFLDIMVLVETKLNNSFTDLQLKIEGYKAYRLDRNEIGGGVLIYVRKEIPCKQLQRHNFLKHVEALFLEINLRKSKLLFGGMYHSRHEVYGTSDVEFFEQIGFALDTYSNYDKFLLAGDFNVQVGESSIDDFLDACGAKNLVKDFTCFKSTENPSCIDLFLTNSSSSFHGTATVSTGLSDFHNMIVTVCKTTFPKVKPKLVVYRDYSKFTEKEFR